MKWKDVQKDITEDIKKRRELGLIITTTEHKARETSYSLARAESLLVREKESHEQTVVILKETTEKFTSVKNELEITRKKVEILSEEKKINGKETLNVLKEMKRMEDNTIKMN